MQDQAKVVFKEALNSGGVDSRKWEASAAAALYIACRMQNVRCFFEAPSLNRTVFRHHVLSMKL